MVALGGEVVTGDFLSVVAVNQAAEGVFHLAEILSGVVADGEYQRFDVGGHAVEGNGNLFVVAVAVARAVVAAVLDRAVFAAQVVEIDDVYQFVFVVEHKAGCVQINGVVAAAEQAA